MPCAYNACSAGIKMCSACKGVPSLQGVRIVLSTRQSKGRDAEAGSPDSVLDAHAALAEHAGRKRKRAPEQEQALGQLRARLQAECAQVWGFMA